MGAVTPINKKEKEREFERGNKNNNFSVKKRSSKEDEKTSKLILRLQKKWEESKTPEYANAL